MGTEIWIIVVSVLISILSVSLLGFFLNRSYRKRRSLTETEKDLESYNDQRSNSPITEAPPSLSLERNLEADYDFSINEAAPSLYSPKEDLEADYDCPPNSPTNEAPASPYSADKALQDLIDYQRYYLKRRPDNGESATFTTSLWGTTINHVPSKFSSLPGAQPFFSFESAQPRAPRTEGGNGILRRTSREVDLRGRMLEIH